MGIKVGTIVRWTGNDEHHGDVGVVTHAQRYACTCPIFRVQWMDGETTEHPWPSGLVEVYREA